jgi:hypothetical protein
MTIQPWPQPRYQLHPTVPDDRYLTQYVIEAAIRLGSNEYEEPELAVAIIRSIRPDLTAEHAERWARELVEIANDAEDCANEPRVNGRYWATLHDYEVRLVWLATRPDDFMAVAYAVQDRDELAERRKR